jgi:hypothetical protein
MDGIQKGHRMLSMNYTDTSHVIPSAVLEVMWRRTWNFHPSVNTLTDYNILQFLHNENVSVHTTNHCARSLDATVNETHNTTQTVLIAAEQPLLFQWRDTRRAWSSLGWTIGLLFLRGNGCATSCGDISGPSTCPVKHNQKKPTLLKNKK